ncbi:MAG: GIY-YIG nuclease family protein [Ignavibacteriaceae bacterium]
MSFNVYILKSLNVERFYIGSTSDMQKKLEMHNSFRAKWTKRYQPWTIVYTEEFATRSEAVKREKFLKSLKNIKRFLEGVTTLKN